MGDLMEGLFVNHNFRISSVSITLHVIKPPSSDAGLKTAPIGASVTLAGLAINTNNNGPSELGLFLHSASHVSLGKVSFQ